MKLSLSLGDDIYSGLHLVCVDAINFIQYSRLDEGVYFYTSSTQYFTQGSLKYWITNLKKTGYLFEKVDRTSALHIPNVKKLDDRYKIAYFEEDTTRTSVGCPIAVVNYNQIKEMVQMYK